MTLFALSPQPKVYEQTVNAGTNFGGSNRIAFPGIAVSCSITNYANQNILVRFNDDSAAVATLDGLQTLSFPRDEVHLTSIDFSNAVSGSSNVAVQVIVGVL